MLEPRIQQHFFESADLLNQSAETLSRPVADAADALVACITAGGRLLVTGSDVGAVLAPVIALAFTGRFERDRPALAAVVLGHQPGGDALQQLRALGQPGDLLLVLDGGGSPERLMALVAVAHAQELSAIVFTGADASAWRAALAETDVLVAVPHERAARVAELHLLMLHALCDAVDLQLMGEQEPS